MTSQGQIPSTASLFIAVVLRLFNLQTTIILKIILETYTTILNLDFAKEGQFKKQKQKPIFYQDIFIKEN